MQSTLQSNSASFSEPSQNGSNSHQYRYKKALKEINKLVNINSTIKTQLEKWKQSYIKLEQDYRQLEGKYNEQLSKATKKNYEQHLNDNSQPRPVDLEFRNSTFSQGESYHVFSNKVSQYEMQVPNVIQIQEQFSQQITYLKQQISEYDIKISQKDDLISELQIALEKKHSEVIQLQGRCGDLNERIEKIKVDYQEIEKNCQIKISEQIDKNKKTISDLQQKLRKAEGWSKKIQQDYELIKKSIVLSQPAVPEIVSSLKFSDIGRLRTEHNLTLRNRLKSKSKYKESPQKLDEITKMKNEYLQKKTKYKNQITRLKQEIDDMTKRMYSMSSFIEKQQLYIQAYIDKNEQIQERMNE